MYANVNISHTQLVQHVAALLLNVASKHESNALTQEVPALKKLDL